MARRSRATRSCTIACTACRAPTTTWGSANDIVTGFQSDARKFTELVQRLAEIQDVDGSRLLDNTLVVWASDMG